MKIKTAANQLWIEAGYQTFAKEGPKGLKIERLASQIQKNKSSFYHYFSDLDFFTEHLLGHHLEQAQILAEKEWNCHSLEELIEVLVDHKKDLLFNRQLRIHRNNDRFRVCFEKTNALTVPAISNLWAKMLNLDDHTFLADLVYKIAIENFYLQITEENLNPTWLHNYMCEYKELVKAFKSSNPSDSLNGSV